MAWRLAFVVTVLAACGRIGFDARTDGSADGDGASVAGIRQIALGARHTCAVTSRASVRCWGANEHGQLGYGNTTTIGDDEPASAGGDVPLGAPVKAVTAGAEHTCALLETGGVRCWGNGDGGRLGNLSTAVIGDDEPVTSLGDIDLGGPVAEIAAAYYHTCARLQSGDVRCWGRDDLGNLGYSSTLYVGDDETPASKGSVNLGLVAASLCTGENHTCARSAAGALQCWGYGFWGQLGRGSTANIGDDEVPSAAGLVPAPSVADVLGCGASIVCIVQNGVLRCWGGASYGQLGYGNVEHLGDNEPITGLSPLPLPPVADVSGGFLHTCARLTTGTVRCWGRNDAGESGQGNTTMIGDDEPISSLLDIDLGATATAIAAGEYHTCAILSTGAVRCWGLNDVGQLGYGHTRPIGDDETPASAGDVPIE